MKRLLVSVGVLLVLAGGTATAQNWLTLPAADSFVGGAPFFSDVRAFNTSYTSSLDVTATYHCFIPSPCAAGTPSVTFTLEPRESHAFDDMVLNTFNAPDTAGGVEFGYAGTQEQLVVTSRLFSTQPEPTVGMFIPGLPDSEAFPTTVLTSVRNLGSGPSFRTNVGVYNRTDAAASVTFVVFDGGLQVGNPVTIDVGAHAGGQVSGIFTAAGEGTHETQNAVVVVSSTQPVFSYAAVIDNNTTDPIFVVGAQDQPLQAFTPVATGTPSGPTVTPPAPTATGTPTPPGPTATPTPPPGTRTVNVGQGGMNFVDQVSGNSTTTIPVGTTVHWVWVGSPHSTTSGPCPPCNPVAGWNSGVNNSGFTFDFTFNTAGTFPYYCTVHLQSMTGTVTVTP